MDALSEITLRSQTIFGCTRFLLFLVSWPTIIGLLNGYLDKDRLTFNCEPKPSDVIKQLCYNRYTSTMSPRLIPLNFTYVVSGVFGFFWGVIIFYSAKVLPQIKREQDRAKKGCQSRRFWRNFLSHVCVELAVLVAMMVLFFHYQTVSLPVIFKCPQRNATTQIPVHQGKNLTCSDLYYRQKSRLNIGIISVMAVSMFLCILVIGHSLWKKDTFIQELVDWQSSSDPEESESVPLKNLEEVQLGQELETEPVTVTNMSKRSKKTGTSSKDKNDVPPQLNVDVPLTKKYVKSPTKRADEAHLPVDVLLLTFKDCEFLACYKQLNNPYRCWFDDLGYVYFEGVDESCKEKVKVALIQCYEGSTGPGGSLISVKNAANVLHPKAVISVGTCSGLKPQETRLGDVVVSAKLTTHASKVVTSTGEQSTGMQSYVSRRFLNVIKHAADGWEAPLMNPGVREIKVHCDGEFLRGPEEVSAEWRCTQLVKSHPQATAIELEGEGVFTVAFDDQIEWLIVKGIADYAGGAELTTESWSPFASVMAASVVKHITKDSAVFSSWPHCGDSSKASSFKKSKRKSPFSGIQDPKCLKLEDSATAFLKWSQNQLCSFYNSAVSQVMISPWDRDNTMDIDEVYVELSLLRDDRKMTGTEKQKLKDYSEIFEGRGHNLVPKRILVYGRPGIGKSTFTKKLAVDWSRGEKEILKKFDVFLLIKLRDVCGTENLYTMLKKAELLSADDPTVFDQLYEYVLQNQQKVLLVLDGFDEYSAQKSSPVHQIWRGSQLRDCAVVVTTRPTKEDELRPPSHAQFEISGFVNKEQVEQFALKFLCDQEDVKEFTDFLTERDLWDMAEIPLLLLMLCLTWKEEGRRRLLTSRANLYESFFQTLRDHVAAKKSEQAFTSIDEYKEDLTKLGKPAFDALLEDCLYLKLNKLPEDVRLLIEKFIDVGFFQISKLPNSPRPEQVACFLHKSIQEFLSAWFIVQELKRAKKESAMCLSLAKIDSFEKIKKMEEVLKFVSESSSEAASAVLSHLQMIGEKEGLTEYSFTDTPSVEELSEGQLAFRVMCLDVLLSCPVSDKPAVYPTFLQCVNSVLVINADKQLHTVAGDHLFKFCPKPDYLFFDEAYGKAVNDDVVSIMRDLETVMVTCSGDTKAVMKVFSGLQVKDFFLKKEGQQMILYLSCIHKVRYDDSLLTELLRVLSPAPESAPQKPGDHVTQNQDNSSALYLPENTSDQTHKHSLSFVREIEIKHPTREEELRVVKDILPFVDRPRVIEIDRRYSRESYYAQTLESLISLIPFTGNLQEFRFCALDLSAKSATEICRSLHQAPNLQKLALAGNPFRSSERELRLRSVHMGDQECRLLATSLKYVNQLQELDLSCNLLGQGITELAKHLTSVPHLTELDLNDTQMGEEEVTAVARNLQNVAELKELYLLSNPLGQGITELAKHLTSVPHLTKLGLSDTQMGEEEVTAVARALVYVPELVWLDLSDNPLGRGVNELIQHLSSVPQLKDLWLSGVKMTKKEASELCTAVRGRGIFLDTAYHTWYPGMEDRLRTEAELKEDGVTFDEE